nr:basic 7s globulin [Quercus suber]POF25886.1 basic 7s globulin [Quercus suber]
MVLCKPVPCGSSKCKIAKGIGCLGCNGTPRPGCTNNTCPLFSYNPFNNSLRTGGLDSGSLNGLAKVTKGILGLGRTQIALPMQLANAFELKRKFALCVPSSSQSGLGDIFIGGGPYYMLPYTKNVSELLITTLLIINPAVLKDFVKKAAPRKITIVASVAPFEACFNSKTIASTMNGPAVPTIDLVLQSKSMYWGIYGANSMVKAKENVLCLGVVYGGSKPRTSIVIGGHLVEG